MRFHESSTLPPLPGFRARHWLALLAAIAIYATVTIAQWGPAYIDFGDGNYMYIGTRIAQGAVVYRDVLAPQPPMHLFTGAAIAKLAQWVQLESPVYAFRGFSLGLHLATLLLLVVLAWRAWGQPSAAVLAGAIWLWLPIGYWWALGYQSEPLENFFLLAMILCSLRGSWGGDLATGLFAALAGLTNATAAPFLLVLIVFMAVRAPRRAARMALPCIVIVGIVTAVLHAWTDGRYLENVVFNQVGTYPTEGFAAYALSKLMGQGNGVLFQEGFFLFVALLALARYLRDSPLPPVAREGVAWFCLATLCAIVYVTKGGTVDYIFSLSEPAVALLAAGELHAWGRRWGQSNPIDPPGPHGAGAIAPPRLVKWAAAALLAVFAMGPGLFLYTKLWHQRPPFELPERQAEHVRRLIKRYSSVDEPIVAPPFYAFMANRRIWGDYSELLIWHTNYRNDRAARDPEGSGWRKVREMAAELRKQTMPIVLIELDQQGTIPEIMQALQATYRPLQPEPIATNNTRLGVFVPVREADGHRVREEWAAFEQTLRRMHEPGRPWRFAEWLSLDPRASMTERLAPPVSAPTPTPTPVPTVEPTATATPTPVPEPTPEPTATATPTPSPTPAPPTTALRPAIPDFPTSESQALPTVIPDADSAVTTSGAQRRLVPLRRAGATTESTGATATPTPAGDADAGGASAGSAP